MRNIALIMRRELLAYVRTPSGYIIAALILLFEAVVFNAYAVGSEPRPSTEVLLRFLEVSGGTTIVAAVLFTMRLLAEERASGTHVLLFTSPIREGEVVLGKYLASLSFIIVLILMSLYLPALIFVHGKVSYGHIASGYLGMILLGATTLAVGMLASSLVKHPFLAVLLAGAFAAMLEISWFASAIADEPLKDILGYFAPYYRHYQPFRRGIVQLSDVVFFLTVIYFSLLASTRVLKSQRWQ